MMIALANACANYGKSELLDELAQLKNEIATLNKAVEFAEYVCKSFESMMDEENETLQRIDDGNCGFDSWDDYFSSSERGDQIKSVKLAIHNFRKRK